MVFTVHTDVPRMLQIVFPQTSQYTAPFYKTSVRLLDHPSPPMLEAGHNVCLSFYWHTTLSGKRLCNQYFTVHGEDVWIPWSDFFAAHAGSSEHNDKFHHWHQGTDAGVAIQLEDPKFFYCLVRKGMHNLAMRQVWDGGDIVANIRPDSRVKEVKP